MRSQTRRLDGLHVNGSGYWMELSQTGRHARYAARYLDYSPGFQTDLGFVPRVDIRKMEHFFEYYWRPKNGRVLLFGPDVTTSVNWNRQGQVQNWVVDAVRNRVPHSYPLSVCFRSMPLRQLSVPRAWSLLTLKNSAAGSRIVDALQGYAEHRIGFMLPDPD
jgi:hypothetical protein